MTENVPVSAFCVSIIMYLNYFGLYLDLEGSWIEIHCFSSFQSTFLVIIDIYF